MIIIIVSAATTAGRYQARLASDGTLLVVSRKQPFFDGARRLLELGYAPDTVLVMMYANSDIECLRAPLGAAAALTVAEGDRDPPRFRRWKPMRPREGSPPVAPNDEMAVVVTEEARQ
jgi:hypothetical protein